LTFLYSGMYRDLIRNSIFWEFIIDAERYYNTSEKMLDKETIVMTRRKRPRAKSNCKAFLRCLERVKQLHKDGEKGIGNEQLLRAIDRYLESSHPEKRHRKH